MQCALTSRKPRRGAALTWVVAAVVVLCIAGAIALYVRHKAAQRRNHPVVHLDGPTAS